MAKGTRQTSDGLKDLKILSLTSAVRPLPSATSIAPCALRRFRPATGFRAPGREPENLDLKFVCCQYPGNGDTGDKACG